jgi:hypothetical protein
VSNESDLYDALKGLVGNRVWPDVFPQDIAWPAIRYTLVSAVPETTICGSGNDTVTEFRFQIDAVAKTGVERDALRLSIANAMQSFPTPVVLDSWSKDYDTEAKGYRVQMDYVLHPSG